MRILVTGGRGDLGRRVVPRLVTAGHDVLVGTRRPSPTCLDEVRYSFGLSTEDLVGLLGDVDVIVHLASQPRRPATDVAATESLVRAAASAGVEHLIYVSIVGVDANPLSYYRAKRRTEEVITTSSVPWTILRTTQFHSLLVRFADEFSIGRVTLVPSGIPIQPLDPDLVAERVVELVAVGPSGRVPDMGGPEVVDFAEAIRRVLRGTRARRLVIDVPLTDGGDRRRAARHPIVGAGRVARFFAHVGRGPPSRKRPAA